MKARLVALALVAALTGAGASSVNFAPAATTPSALEQARSAVTAAEGSVKADEAALVSAKATLTAASAVVAALTVEPPKEEVAAGATVSSTPLGPATPSGGWRIAFADDFNAKLGTGIGEDNKWHIASGAGHNSNELETFNPSQVKTGPEGLELAVSYCAGCSESYGTKKNYLGGQVETNSCPACAGLFAWEPAQGDTWAFQVVAKIPRNTGQMDPAWWSTDPSWHDELDLTEWWGWNNFPTTAGGEGEYYAGIPVWKYKTPSTSVYKEIYHPKTEVPNPVSEYHTYTYEITSSNAIEVFIDGKYRWTEPAISSANINVVKMGLIIQNALRVDETSDFKSGSAPRIEDIKSIAVYNNTGLHFANGGIAPGTIVK